MQNFQHISLLKKLVLLLAETQELVRKRKLEVRVGEVSSKNHINLLL
jgi:hypothetical protein